MFEKIAEIAIGSRAGILNRVFTVLMLIIVTVQILRYIRFRFRLSRWRYRLFHLEQDAREEGVVTAIDPDALPPLDPYARFWDIVPSMAIMLGLVGTFIGLTLSLSEIPVTVNVEDIRKGLSSAIPSMGMAFWTSLCGLIVAIIVRIINALMSAEFRDKVVDKLMQSEPQVIDALESAAFQQGRDGALLRPHGVRELLWHQNRLLNQTVSRVAPQVSEGLTRGLASVSQQFPMEEHKALLSELRSMTEKLTEWHQQQNNTMTQQLRHLERQHKQIDELMQQQKHTTCVLSKELAAFQQQIRELYWQRSEYMSAHANMPPHPSQAMPTPVPHSHSSSPSSPSSVPRSTPHSGMPNHSPHTSMPNNLYPTSDIYPSSAPNRTEHTITDVPGYPDDSGWDPK